MLVNIYEASKFHIFHKYYYHPNFRGQCISCTSMYDKWSLICPPIISNTFQWKFTAIHHYNIRDKISAPFFFFPPPFFFVLMPRASQDLISGSSSIVFEGCSSWSGWEVILSDPFGIKRTVNFIWATKSPAQQKLISLGKLSK